MRCNSINDDGEKRELDLMSVISFYIMFTFLEFKFKFKQKFNFKNEISQNLKASYESGASIIYIFKVNIKKRIEVAFIYI